jgi:hypothetical protein
MYFFYLLIEKIYFPPVVSCLQTGRINSLFFLTEPVSRNSLLLFLKIFLRRTVMPEKTLIEKLAELLEVEIIPPLDGNDAQALHKALPGYQAVADDAARFVQKHGATLNLDASVLADLEAGLAEVLRLEPADHALEKLHQSVYHQRLRATDRCMEGLYDTTRRIRDFAEAYPEIAEEGQFLLDFMRAFKPGRKKEKDRDGSGGE